MTYIDGDQVITQSNEEIPREYRHTMFTGIQDKLVVSAVFRFSPTDDDNDQIMERIEYSKREQDLSGPNCGSVFKRFRPGVMVRLRGLTLGHCHYSKKTVNWIINRSPSPRYIRTLIFLAKLAHWLTRQNIEIEIIEVP